MVHHITLFKLKPEVTPEKLEKMMIDHLIREMRRADAPNEQFERLTLQ